jgi:pentatricopeptide repeat protein
VDDVVEELVEHARSSGLLSVKLVIGHYIKAGDAEAAEQLFRELRQQEGRLARRFNFRMGETAQDRRSRDR